MKLLESTFSPLDVNWKNKRVHNKNVFLLFDLFFAFEPLERSSSTSKDKNLSYCSYVLTNQTWIYSLSLFPSLLFHHIHAREEEKKRTDTTPNARERERENVEEEEEKKFIK